MEIVSNRDEMIFKYEYNDKPIYSIGLSKKDKDGNYEKGYMNVRFRKEVELGNMTKIRIKSAWIDFYKKDTRTMPYIFINDFDVVDEIPTKDLTTKTEVQESFEYSDSDLPF